MFRQIKPTKKDLGVLLCAAYFKRLVKVFQLSSTPGWKISRNASTLEVMAVRNSMRMEAGLKRKSYVSMLQNLSTVRIPYHMTSYNISNILTWNASSTSFSYFSFSSNQKLSGASLSCGFPAQDSPLRKMFNLSQGSKSTVPRQKVPGCFDYSLVCGCIGLFQVSFMFILYTCGFVQIVFGFPIAFDLVCYCLTISSYIFCEHV